MSEVPMKITIYEVDRKDSPEILKQNSLIHCSFEELNGWSELEHDLFNEILAYAQDSEQMSSLFGRKLYIRRKNLEKNTSIKRKSNDEIYQILKKMKDTSITIENIYQKNGYKTKAAIPFFDRVYLHEKAGYPSYFEIECSEIFASLCSKNYSLKYGNYTKLHLLKITKLKSKYAKALYELLEANRYKKQFTLKENELKNYLKYKVKDYRFSGMLREIRKVENSVKAYIDFTFTEHKSDKSVTFTIL